MASYTVRSQSLPLAVYREVAAHLHLLVGIRVELLPQSASTFDYGLSQVGGLLIDYGDEAKAEVREQVQRILAYYGDRYGAWEIAETSGADPAQI